LHHAFSGFILASCSAFILASSSAWKVAQELKEIYPFAVSGEVGDKDPEDPTKEAYMSLSRDLLVPVLIKAVQELSAKVTALENA